MAKASGSTLGGKPSKSDQNKDKHVYKKHRKCKQGTLNHCSQWLAEWSSPIGTTSIYA